MPGESRSEAALLQVGAILGRGAVGVGARLCRAMQGLGAAGNRAAKLRSYGYTRARAGAPHSIVLPPFTLMTCPVTNDACAEARKLTTAATSCISPGRPLGMTPTNFSNACG